MTAAVLAVVFGIIAAGAVAALLLRRPSRGTGQEMVMIQQQIQDLRGIVDARLGSSADMFQRQYAETVRIVRDVTERLARLDETNRQVVGVTEQLQSLQDILKNPKQRGILGEYYLETLLKNVLPPGSFQMQYGFKDGTIVDAVVFVRDKVIPVDSKFSVDSYNRLMEEKDAEGRERMERQFRADLKARIDETAKYVKPEEGTMEFAFMFIPHEAIYYDLLIAQVGAVKATTRDLIEYAFKEKRVIIVSPTSFLAYLQTVLQGLKALEIEESAKEIRKRVEDLGRHLSSYAQFMDSMGKALGTTVNHYNKARREFQKIDKDVYRVSGRRSGAELEEVARPREEEEDLPNGGQ